MYAWKPGTPKAMRRRVQIPQQTAQTGQQPGWDRYAQDFGTRVNGGLMGASGGMPDTQPMIADVSKSVQQMVPRQDGYASDYTDIGTGGDDRDAGRMPVGLGAGGDPNAWAASFNGSGLLSDGSANARMNSSAFAAQANSARYGNRDPFKPGGGNPSAPSAPGGATTTGVPDQQAGQISQLGPGTGTALPYDNSVDWTNPTGTSQPSPISSGLMAAAIDRTRPAVDNIPRARDPNAPINPQGMSGWQRFGRGLGAIAAGAIAGPQAGEWAYNQLTPVSQRKPRGGP